MLAKVRGLVAVGLVAIVACSAPAPTSSPPPQSLEHIAHLSGVKGGVQVKANGTPDWIAAQLGMDLAAGDLVRTVPGAAAEISFSDGFVLKLAPDSLLAVEATPRLRFGELAFKAERMAAGSQPDLSAPKFGWKALPEAPEAPAGSISAENSGRGRVEQHRGGGVVETQQGQRLVLGPNERVAVDSDGHAGDRVRLLPAPVLVAPTHQAALTYEQPAKTTTALAWSSVPGAFRYHVVVDDDGWFTEPLHDRADVTDTVLEMRGLPPGKYYWRVASIDEKGIQGAFADFAGFTVAEVAPGPLLTIDAIEVRKSVLMLKGRTEVGASVTVNGQKLEVLGDGSFIEYITLAGGGAQRLVIRAEAAQGRVTTVVKTVSAAGR